jgi:hypothetical protein
VRTTARRQGMVIDTNGVLFVATTNGLVRQDGEVASTGDNHAVHAVYRDPDGAIWAACGDRLCSLENEHLVQTAPELPRLTWRSIRGDGQHNLWLLADGAIWVKRSGDSQFQALPAPPQKSGPFLGDPALEVSSAGEVIVSASNGLCRWDGKSWKTIDTSSGLIRGDISALVADREGSVWVGIAGLGLERWLGMGKLGQRGGPSARSHLVASSRRTGHHVDRHADGTRIRQRSRVSIALERETRIRRHDDFIHGAFPRQHLVDRHRQPRFVETRPADWRRA